MVSANDIAEARHTSLMRHSGLASASRVRSQQKQPRNLEGFDGKPTDAGPITSYALADFQVPGGPMESTLFFVTRLPQVPIIIGLPWMQHH